MDVKNINADWVEGPTTVTAEDVFKAPKSAAKDPAFKAPTGPLIVVADEDTAQNKWKFYFAASAGLAKPDKCLRYPFDSQVRSALMTNPNTVVSESVKRVYINGSPHLIGQ